MQMLLCSACLHFLLSGQCKKQLFKQLYSMVITQTTAKKFFGNEKNVIGKTVRVDNKQDYVVTGVIKDIPENSSVAI